MSRCRQSGSWKAVRFGFLLFAWLVFPSPEAPAATGAPTDVVLGYRNSKRIRELAERSRGRLVVVDEKSAYFRLRPAETEAMAMYRAVKGLLRV